MHKSRKIGALLFAMTILLTALPLSAHALRYDSKENIYYFAPPEDRTVIVEFKEAIKRGCIEENTIVTIAKGDTEVLKEGELMSVYGTLVVEGTLEINGTLTITTREREGILERGRGLGQISNKNKLINNGTIVMDNGTLFNYEKATFTNEGTVQINHILEGRNAITNVGYTSDKGKVDAGTIVNNGTMEIRGTEGVGIRNYAAASFENNGTLSKLEDATITGSISGNTVQLLTK